jgi:hypothetical protein
LFGATVGLHFDFAAVYIEPEDKMKLAWRAYFRQLFAQICEDTFTHCFLFIGELEADQKSARSRRKAAFKRSRSIGLVFYYIETRLHTLLSGNAERRSCSEGMR